jgi:hypothetical protein
VTDVCDHCGQPNGAHGWVDGDCVLPHHHNHAPATVGHVCRWCVDRHRTWLPEIVDLYATLHHVILPGSVPDDTADHKHVKNAEAPVPIRLEAWALLYDTRRLYATGQPSDLPDIPAVICEWAGNLFADAYHSTGPLTLSGAAAVLQSHADAVARTPWVDEYDADLAWCRGALRRVHGLNSAPRLVGRCPALDGDGNTCARPLWPSRDGTMAVECTRPRPHRFDEPYLRHLGGMMSEPA